MSIFPIYCYITNGISVFLNSLLLLLSAHNKIESIRELRYFISNIAVSGIVFSSCLLLLQPQFVVRGTMTIRVIHGPAHMLADNYIKGLASLTVISYLYAILSFPSFFIYRSVILANSNMFGQYFTKRNLIVTFVVMFILCCVEGSMLYYAFIPYDDLFDRLNRTTSVVQEYENNTLRMTQQQRLQDQNTLMLHTTLSPLNGSSGVVQTQEEINMKHRITLIGDDYTRNPLIIIFHGASVICHSLSYLIILICAHFMLKTLKKKQGTMSHDTYLENEVLVHSVFAKAFVPLLLSAPVGANAVLVTLYENSLTWQEFLPMYCMSIVPLLSPLCSILFIGPYRDAVISFITLKGLRATNNSKNNNSKNDDDL